MASSYGHIGVLFTTRGMLDAAVSWNLRSLLIRAELRSPEIGTNFRWLTLPQSLSQRRGARYGCINHRATRGIQRIMPRTFGVLWIAVRIKATALGVYTGIEPCTNMILR
jgi:hypothetical protein